MNSLRLNLDKQNICRKQLLQEYLPDVSKEVYWNAGGPIHRPCIARSGHTDLCLPNKERGPFLDEVMAQIDYESILEVGCNLGYNIAYLGQGKKLAVGVEPLYYLLGSNEFCGVGGTAFALPFADNTFDLVFVAGVLCHIAQEHLLVAISECIRVCKKKLLVVDYYSEVETPMPFRGTMLLWSRDFVSEVARIQQTNVIQMGLALGWSSMQMSYAIFDKI